MVSRCSISDFIVKTSKVKGVIKPMHAVNNGPMRVGGGPFELLKEAGIPYARLHDTGGAFGAGVYVDIANVFRNFDADPINNGKLVLEKDAIVVIKVKRK